MLPNTVQTPGPGAARALPWSTRAVILLAFAIQLGSLGERLGHPGSRPGESLRLCDGQLLALWLDESAPRQARVAAPAGWAREPAGEPRAGSAGADDAWSPPGLDQVSAAVLPIPPPAVC